MIKRKGNLKKLSVITFNAQGKPSFSKDTYKRFYKIAEKLNLEKVDIINLQEVFTYKHLKILKAGLKKFPYCIFEKSIIGPKGGLVTFSKHPLRKQKYVPFSFRFKSTKDWFKNIVTGKGILISKTRSEATLIVNTHLTAEQESDWDKSSQVAELCRSMNLINNYRCLVISGDFNIPKKSLLYRELIIRLSARDVFEEYSCPTFHKEFLSRGESGHRLDYLLVKTNKLGVKIVSRKHIFTKKLISKNINKGFVSDHLGLKAVFELEPYSVS